MPKFDSFEKYFIIIITNHFLNHTSSSVYNNDLFDNNFMASIIPVENK